MTRVVKMGLLVTTTIVRGGIGGCELLAPTFVAGIVESQPIDVATRRTIRVLGVRHLVQSALEAAAPRPDVVRVGMTIDALHLLTMVAYGLGASDPARRRLARTDAVVASAFALSGLLAIAHR